MDFLKESSLIFNSFIIAYMTCPKAVYTGGDSTI